MTSAAAQPPPTATRMKMIKLIATVVDRPSRIRNVVADNRETGEEDADEDQLLL